MNGPENELVIVSIKMRISTFLYWSQLFFCNSNCVTSSTMNGEMHEEGWVVRSRMIVENMVSGSDDGHDWILFMLSGEWVKCDLSRIWEKIQEDFFLRLQCIDNLNQGNYEHYLLVKKI